MNPFAAAVREGLTRPHQKTLPCEYLYDAVGTALFQAISLLPEYGLTRADDRLLEQHAPEIVKLAMAATVAELGSGDGVKTRHILSALRGGAAYYPIDVSQTALDACRIMLSDSADVRPVLGSYLEGLAKVTAERCTGDRLLVLFLGSTIGNFDPVEAEKFLSKVAGHLQSGDSLLLGADLLKPEDTLIAAYDDAAGVTAAFNKNLLVRINRELGGNFDSRVFVHEAHFDRRHRRIEMHLCASRSHEVRIEAAGCTVGFSAGETIWTESSHKFELQEVQLAAERSGFRAVRQWVDSEWPFVEALFERI